MKSVGTMLDPRIRSQPSTIDKITMGDYTFVSKFTSPDIFNSSNTVPPSIQSKE